MTQWEYLVEAVPALHAGDVLAKAGADGWELVSVLAVGFAHPLQPQQATPGVQCFFKRRATPDLCESVGLARHG